MDANFTFATAATQAAAAFWLAGLATVNVAGATYNGVATVIGATANAVTSMVTGTPAPTPIADDWVDLEPNTLLREVQASENLELTSDNSLVPSDPT